jgi:hypothetical protein
MYVPRILYSLLSTPTNAQHIYIHKQYFIYRKHYYMCRCVCVCVAHLPVRIRNLHTSVKIYYSATVSTQSQNWTRTSTYRGFLFQSQWTKGERTPGIHACIHTYIHTCIYAHNTWAYECACLSVWVWYAWLKQSSTVEQFNTVW